MTELLKRFPTLTSCVAELDAARALLLHCYQNGGKLLLCGNGGSCADCDHIVGELMKGFLKRRPLSQEKKNTLQANCPDIETRTLDLLQDALPAISLPSITALNSAFCNDVEPDLVYAQSLLALAKQEDVLVAISTSGNSSNVLHAARLAKGLGIKVLSLTGKSGGALRVYSDVCVMAPETETFKVQELHLPIYHWLCAEIEAHFFNEYQ